MRVQKSPASLLWFEYQTCVSFTPKWALLAMQCSAPWRNLSNVWQLVLCVCASGTQLTFQKFTLAWNTFITPREKKAELLVPWAESRIFEWGFKKKQPKSWHNGSKNSENQNKDTVWQKMGQKCHFVWQLWALISQA